MSLVLLLQIGFLSDEMRHKAYAAIIVLLEGQSGSGFQLFSAEGRMHGDEVTLAVVQHLVEVARLFELVTGDTPLLLDVRPIDLGLVDGLVLVFVLLLLCSVFTVVWILFHFLLVFVVNVIGWIDAFALDFRLCLFRPCEQLFKYACRGLGESESCRLLALADKVREEVVKGIAVLVELKERLCVFFPDGHFNGISDAVHACDNTTLSRLVVRDNQHVLVGLQLLLLVFFFLVHCLLDFESC